MNVNFSGDLFLCEQHFFDCGCILSTHWDTKASICFFNQKLNMAFCFCENVCHRFNCFQSLLFKVSFLFIENVIFLKHLPVFRLIFLYVWGLQICFILQVQFCHTQVTLIHFPIKIYKFVSIVLKSVFINWYPFIIINKIQYQNLT